MKLRDIIGQSFYVANNKLTKDLKLKTWYEITKRSTDAQLIVRPVGASKLVQVPFKAFVDGNKHQYLLFIEDMET